MYTRIIIHYPLYYYVFLVYTQHENGEPLRRAMMPVIVIAVTTAQHTDTHTLEPRSSTKVARRRAVDVSTVFRRLSRRGAVAADAAARAFRRKCSKNSRRGPYFYVVAADTRFRVNPAMTKSRMVHVCCVRVHLSVS